MRLTAEAREWEQLTPPKKRALLEAFAAGRPITARDSYTSPGTWRALETAGYVTGTTVLAFLGGGQEWALTPRGRVLADVGRGRLRRNPDAEAAFRKGNPGLSQAACDRLVSR